MKQKLMYLFMILFLFSCEIDDSIKEEEQVNQELVEQQKEVETPQSNKVYSLRSKGYPFQAQRLNDSTFVYQGDILIPDRNINIEGYAEGKALIDELKAIVRDGGLWLNNEIYYEIDPFLSENARADVAEAIRWIEAESYLNFIERTSQRDYIYITHGNACSSFIGRVGGRQLLYLGESGCGVGSTAHELLHAVGFWHEQTRNDRDQYVDVFFENIRDNAEHNFYTLDRLGFGGYNLTDTYDYYSLMAYSSYSFSINGRPTMLHVNGSILPYNRSRLSEGDKMALKILYPEINTEPTYINGQYYTIGGITVYRFDNKWYFLSEFGWKEVIQRDGNWYYARTNVVPPSLPDDYENGKYYTLYGLQVYRFNNKWFYKSDVYGWRQVELRNDTWYYARTNSVPTGLPN